MKKNLGSADKIIRLLIAAVFAVMYFTGVVTGVWGFVLLALAAILAVTALVNFCPLYHVIGINTCAVKKRA